MFRKKDRWCTDCIFAKYHKSNCILGCEYTCYLNPFKPIVMGLIGRHSERKKNKKEQYPKKDS